MLGSLRVFQRWTIRQAGSDRALWMLGLVSFAESALAPIPIETVSIPVMMANTKRVWLVALIAAAASVAGGMVGYAIGLFLYQNLGSWLLSLYGYKSQFAQLQADFQNLGWLVVMIGGLTPLPYKLVSMASGVAQLSFATFVAASLLSRTLRFMAFALLFW